MLVYTNEDLNLEIHSLDSSRWNDFEALFGERGACGGCWCMAWRLKKSEFESQKGLENKNAMKNLVEENNIIGVLAYIDGKPIGWCAAAPREVYVRLEKSRVLKRVDDEPVWSVSCLFIEKAYRRKDISKELIKGAVNYCRINGGEILEAYPVIPYDDKTPDVFLWTGIPASFRKVGFMTVEQRSKSRPIMRYYI